MVKPESRSEALQIFDGTGIQLAGDRDNLAHKSGQHHLGAAVGSADFVTAYLDAKVEAWAEQVDRLANIAATQPHAAYAAFIFGLRHRWSFIQHTMPTTSAHMQPLQDAIRGRLIPALTKHDLSDVEVEMVALPARHGGLSFDHPVNDSTRKHAESLECTANLSNQIATSGSDLLRSIELDQVAKSIGRQRYKIALEATAADIQARLPPPQQRAMSLAREKGGSSTLTTMPIAEHGFYFHVKSDFHDHIRLPK